jgi:hypothetical protein
MAHPGSVFGDPAEPTARRGRGGSTGRRSGGPSLFAQVLPGLFANQSAAGIPAQTFGERFRERAFGGLLGPSKRQKEGLKIEQDIEQAMIDRRAEGIAGQIRLAGRGDALSFPAVRDQVQAAALGDEQAQANIQSLLIAETKAQATQRQAGELTQQQQAAANLRQTQLTNRQAALDQSGGQFGSFLSGQEFRDINEKVGAQMAGASSLFAIADTVEALTDAQILAFGAGTGGDLQGEIEAELFGLMRPLQTLLEQGKGSVLRESDAKLIRAVTGDPSSFVTLVFSREAKTLARLRRLGELLVEQTQISTSPLDARTMALLDPVNRIRPSPFSEPKGTKRDPEGAGALESVLGKSGLESVVNQLTIPRPF